jgi:hypothetical protein
MGDVTSGQGNESPAGWYSDLTGRHHHRYWDGAQWTDQVSDSGVTATDPTGDLTAAAQPPAQLATQQATDAVVLSIGDIGVTRNLIVTPNGSAPLKGSQWIVRDATRQEQRIPPYAIVLAIVFAFLCLIGLLFLLVKETKTVGFVEVTVTSGNLMYMTQVPSTNPYQVNQIRSQVAQAQSMAAAAN